MLKCFVCKTFIGHLNNKKYCEKCRPIQVALYQKNYQKENREYFRKHHKLYYQANKEQIKEQRYGYRQQPKIKARKQELNRKYYQVNKERLLAQQNKYYQKNKKQILEHSKQPEVRKRQRKYAKKYYQQPKVKELNHKYGRERYHRMGGRGYQRYRKELYIEQRGVCPLCNKSLFPFGTHLHVDHIKPISKDGTSDRSNLQVTHPSCNLSKGNRQERSAI